MEKYYTAIVYTKEGIFKKYRNIKNFSFDPADFYNPKFKAFIVSINGSIVNLYSRDTKIFFKQFKV